MATMAANRILIVEDDASIRAMMSRHFRRNGFEVEQAGAAEDALSRLSSANARFDVVLTDIHLPGASGVDFARRLHETQPEQPVVFMTGDADAGMARSAIEEGAAGYLLKPFEFFELDAVVNQAVQRRAAAAESAAAVISARPTHITKPARVVLRSSHRRSRRFSQRARVAFSIMAFVAVAFVVGAGTMPAPVTAAAAAAAQDKPEDRPLVIPVVIERNVYMNK